VLSRGEFLPQTRHEGGAATGLDARMGIWTGATLSATFNPTSVRSSRTGCSQPQRLRDLLPGRSVRSFSKTAGRSFHRTALFRLFHSRRIGRSPGRLPLAAGERRLDAPAETTILGATKLTGKGHGWTFGALTALTSREYADVESPVDGADGTTSYVRSERLIEPATSYNVARIQRDVMNGSSNIGAIVTGVIREQTDDAFTGGFDYNLRWNRNRTAFNGHWAVTRAPGPGGIKTSGGGLTNLNYSSKHLNLSSHYDHFGRDFRVNDIGFSGHARTAMTSTGASSRQSRPVEEAAKHLGISSTPTTTGPTRSSHRPLLRSTASTSAS
jgi:hypothetical protein